MSAKAATRLCRIEKKAGLFLKKAAHRGEPQVDRTTESTLASQISNEGLVRGKHGPMAGEEEITPTFPEQN